MTRRVVSLLASLTVLLALAVQPASAVPPEVPDGMTAYAVIPPGQSGSVWGPQGAHRMDQMEMYKSLINDADDNVTTEELSTYFHDFQFGTTDIEREYAPADRTDVTVYRDSLGIPHIFGTDEGVGFALGYVTAEDRLWHMHVLRAAAKGQLGEVLGADAPEGHDAGIRRDGYSLKEVKKIFNRFDDKYGVAGKKTQQLVKNYAKGVNAYINEVRNFEVPKPPEFQNQGIEPQNWTATDTLFLAIFQLRDFGGGGGGELRNAALLQGLEARFDPVSANLMFEEILRRNDPGAYSTIPAEEGTFDSQDLGTSGAGVAIPDDAATLLSAPSEGEKDARAFRIASPSSNFLAVAPELSATGGSLEWGGPQVGYSVPQFFMEVDVHGDSFDFRGPALPGASMLVPLGRSTNFAWSLTTGVSDAVDVRVEKLCKPIKKGKKKGKPSAKKPGANSAYYEHQGKCKKMNARTETINVKGGESSKLKVQRTVHGPVESRGTVDGWPVAIVTERFYWKKEADALPIFFKVVTETESVEDFSDLAAKFAMSFNAVYADAEDIGYFHIGHFPKRAKGVNTMLPSWGTGKWDFKGRRPFSTNPHVINPSQGWIANWNNRPAAGWEGGDSTNWGPAGRSRLLSDQMEVLAAAGDITLADIVNVIRVAATQDSHGVRLGPEMTALVAPDPGTEADALDAVEAWIAGGAHRLDRDGDGNQDEGNAVAVFDAWYDNLVDATFDDEFAGLYNLFNRPKNDGAEPSNGSAYFADFSDFLFNLLTVPDGYAINYCENVDTDPVETCAELVQQTFEAAVAETETAQGTGDVSMWTREIDTITFSSVGADPAFDIPWQNRGTWNQAIQFDAP